MRSFIVILTGTLLSFLAQGTFAQTAQPPRELRRLVAPAPVTPATAGAIQVIDLRSPVAGGAGTAMSTPNSQVLAAKQVGPAAGRSLAPDKLAEALRGAQIALATQNVYATLTPGHLVAENKAVTRVYSGVNTIDPQAVGFYIGAGKGAQVAVTLRESGVYLVDYTYTYSSGQKVQCTVQHANVSQSVWLRPWQEGESANHVVVAVNYTAPSQWPDPGNSYSSVQLWCYPPEPSTGTLYLYSINVTKP